MYSALTSKKIKLEVKDEVDWKVEIKDELQIKFEYSENPRYSIVLKDEDCLDEKGG